MLNFDDVGDYIEVHWSDVLPDAVRQRAMAYRHEYMMEVIKSYWNGKRVAQLVYRTRPFFDFIPTRRAVESRQSRSLPSSKQSD